MESFFKLGSWNAICDVCGFQYKADKLRKNWKGLYVCREDWEPRHPQDYLKARKETVGVPWSRPPSTDVYAFSCDLWTSSPMADFGTADCMTAGGNTSIPLLIETFATSAVPTTAIASRTISGVTF